MKPKPTQIPRCRDGRVFVRHAAHPCVCCGRETLGPSRKYLRVDMTHQYLAGAHEDYEIAPIGPACFTEHFSIVNKFLARR